MANGSGEQNINPRYDTPLSVTAAALVEFFGSALALVVSTLFLLSAIGEYQESKKLVRIYGPASAYHFYPAFFLVYIVFPMAGGLLGIVCAFGVSGLREWARKGTLFLAMVPVLICLFLALFRPNSVFPDAGKEGLA